MGSEPLIGALYAKIGYYQRMSMRFVNISTAAGVLVLAAAGYCSADNQFPQLSKESMTNDPGSCSTSAGACGLPTDDAELRKLLTPEQYYITKQNGTERPFANAFWDNHRAGIYVDVISGEPLFSSTDKFDSGTGWPSFTKPISKEVVVETSDTTLGMKRIEVRSKKANSHLGHVFDDGPKPSGLRYCINSGSLKFIPREELEKSGYGQLGNMFESENSGPK